MSDSEYKQAYTAWIATLTPAERAEVDGLGLAAPYIDPQGVGSPQFDEARAADLLSAEKSSPEPDPHDDAKLAQWRIEKRVRESTRKIVCEILGSKNARLTTECLSLVTGIGYLGVSETSIAADFGITRAAVSKRCVELCKKLGLPPSRAMRSEEARNAYRESRLKVLDKEKG